MGRRLRRTLRTLWILAGLSFTIWMGVGFQAVGVPDDVVKNDAYVTVTSAARGIEFRGLKNPRPVGVIFLPGGLVEPIAYAPLVRKLAAAGYTSHLLYLPMRCACTDSQVQQLFVRIHEVMATEPGMAWVLAGHSRGGMLAARFAHENPSVLAGLILIGTTHPRDFSLASLTMPVAKIYGTRDGIASWDKIRQNQNQLPPGTLWIGIEGGNHVQFGYYRHQLGDDDPAISRAGQQMQVETAMLKLLSSAGAAWNGRTGKG